jgi:hypothetical protein
MTGAVFKIKTKIHEKTMSEQLAEKNKKGGQGYQNE